MSWSGTFKLSLPVLAAVVVTGCMLSKDDPRDRFELTPEQLQNREMRTRMFEGITGVDILSASTAVLQDLGFTIDETEVKLGVVTGTKRADASNTFDETVAVLTAILSLGTESYEYDEYQRFRASVVVRPVSIIVRPLPEKTSETYYVSVTFQRTVWNNDDEVTRRETLEVPDIYQDFFDKLSKSVFLEAQGI